MPKTYPVSEIFFSVQGEGQQSGTPMIFVRLAGCTVGKPYKPGESLLPIWQNECTIYDGRTFPCDTDYRKKRVMTIDAILADIKAQNSLCNWVSITGGEPLMHDLNELLGALKSERYNLHIDTSGTVKGPTGNPLDLLMAFDHVVVSPKFPFLDAYVEFADEIRLLVDSEFDWHKLPKSILEQSDRVWISPVNPTDGIDKRNAAKCVDILRQHPEVRLSLQIHKILGVR